MSLMPNSVPGDEQESFHHFFESWIAEQDRHLDELLSASKAQAENRASGGENEERKYLRPLIDKVVQHYEEYYRVKVKCSKEDVLSMLSPTWTSSLEDAFLWIGGWRPSMAFHLLYSKSGLQMEAKLADIIRGLGSNDLGDMSPCQLVLVDELQSKTIKEERMITEKMAKHQQTVADTAVVELSQMVTESQNIEMEDYRVELTLAPTEEKLQNNLERADDLRLRTLKGVIAILKPNQAVHFLIAAAELHLRIHEWGQKRDAANGIHQQIPNANGTNHLANAGRTQVR